jgi:hypothetical protein
MADTPHLVSDRPDHVEYELICPVCKERRTITVKKEITKNMERYPFEYLDIHGDPPHGLTLYIDKNWAVRGMEILKNINMALKESNSSSKAKLVPKKKTKISPMAQQLGIVSKKEFEILEKIDGKRNIEEIAKTLKIEIDDINPVIQKLVEKSMIVIEVPK